MIISDLEHLEVVAEGTNIVGGGKKPQAVLKLVVVELQVKKPAPLPVNEASADAAATALGTNTQTITNTNAEVVQGQRSSSQTVCFAAAS